MMCTRRHVKKTETKKQMNACNLLAKEHHGWWNKQTIDNEKSMQNQQENTIKNVQGTVSFPILVACTRVSPRVSHCARNVCTQSLVLFPCFSCFFGSPPVHGRQTGPAAAPLDLLDRQAKHRRVEVDQRPEISSVNQSELVVPYILIVIVRLNVRHRRNISLYSVQLNSKMLRRPGIGGLKNQNRVAVRACIELNPKPFSPNV